MLISDLTFIFFFMPAFYAVYYLFPVRLRRWPLALGGLLFYTLGNLKDTAFLLVLSIVVWALSKASASRKVFAYVGIAICLAFLAVFKYTESPLGFPLGASFYVFHMISYLIDTADSSESAADPVSLLAYVAMFPKLIMGPIVQYHDIAAIIKSPVTTVQDTADGLMRFVIGLAKKTMLASQLAPITVSLWSDAPNSAISAWLGAICFSMQLYFDFSSYSDMAIGLGKMAGFSFGENFIYPYTSCSVSDFYRRWHASLGRWFRDYMYIPLGGSRKGLPRTLFNLMIVWAATGIWHGSTLNYLIWGAGLGIVICIERITGISKAEKTVFGWLWTTTIIVVSWVVFNSADMASAIEYIGHMFGSAPSVLTHPLQTALHDTWYVIAAAAFFCTPVLKYSCQRVIKGRIGLGANLAKAIVLVALMALSLLVMVNSGYSAFIYTKF